MFIVIILYILLASTFTLGKAALFYLPPFLLIGIRMLLGGAVLLSYYYLVPHRKRSLEKKDYHHFLQIILFHIFISYTFEFWGMEQVSSAKACLLYNLAPFFTALFSYYMLAERFTMQQICGLFVGFLAFIPVLVAQVPHGGFPTLLFFSLHEIALILSVASASYGWIIMKHLTHAGYSFIFVNGVGMVGGGMLSLFASLLLEGAPALKGAFSWHALGMLSLHTAGLIIVANIVCYNVYGYLLSRYSPTFLSLAGLITPLFAAVLGWFFLGEVITWHFCATFVLVMCGMYLFYNGD